MFYWHQSYANLPLWIFVWVDFICGRWKFQIVWFRQGLVNTDKEKENTICIVGVKSNSWNKISFIRTCFWSLLSFWSFFLSFQLYLGLLSLDSHPNKLLYTMTLAILPAGPPTDKVREPFILKITFPLVSAMFFSFSSYF